MPSAYREFAEKALAEWGKPEGELLYAKRAPAPLYEKWKKAGAVGIQLSGMLPTSGALVFENHIFKEYEDKYGGTWDMVADPIEHAHAIIAHIDKKRQALGIDKARERVMMDFASRQAL